VRSAHDTALFFPARGGQATDHDGCYGLAVAAGPHKQELWVDPAPGYWVGVGFGADLLVSYFCNGFCLEDRILINSICFFCGLIR